MFLKLIPFLRVFTLKRVHKKTVEGLGFFADKERRKGKERKGKGKGRVTGKNWQQICCFWFCGLLSFYHGKGAKWCLLLLLHSLSPPPQCQALFVVIGFLGGKILCCGVRVFFFPLVLFFCDYWECPRSRSWSLGGLEWKLVVYLLWTPLIHGHPFSVCRLLLRWGFKYEAGFLLLISFSIFTAVDDVCGWGNLASKPYVHVKPKFLLQALFGTPFCSFELFRRWQLWKCPWSAGLGFILFPPSWKIKRKRKGVPRINWNRTQEPRNRSWVCHNFYSF